MKRAKVLRPIAKKGERQGRGRFDVLKCGHAVKVDGETHANTYRRFRRCATCSKRVDEIRKGRP